jgi:hypothetical protein
MLISTPHASRSLIEPTRVTAAVGMRKPGHGEEAGICDRDTMISASNIDKQYRNAGILDRNYHRASRIAPVAALRFDGHRHPTYPCAMPPFEQSSLLIRAAVQRRRQICVRTG